MQAESSLGSRDREGRTGRSDTRCFHDHNGDQWAVVQYVMFYFVCALTAYIVVDRGNRNKFRVSQPFEKSFTNVAQVKIQGHL